MSYTVVVAVSAARQIADVDAGWSAHRPAAPRAVTDDLDTILSFLAQTPELGRVFVGATRPGVRRILLRHTGHFLYYVVVDTATQRPRARAVGQAEAKRHQGFEVWEGGRPARRCSAPMPRRTFNPRKPRRTSDPGNA